MEKMKTFNAKKVATTATAFEKWGAVFQKAGLTGGHLSVRPMSKRSKSVMLCVTDVEEEPIAKIIGLTMADFDGNDVRIKKYDVENGIIEGEIISELLQKGTKQKAKASCEDFKKEGWPEEEIASRVEFMKIHKFHRSTAMAVIDRLPEYEEGSIKKPAVLYMPDGKNSVMEAAVISALCGFGTLLEGPKSTGKNVMMASIAWLLGVKYFRMNLDQKALPEDLYGSKTTDNSAADVLMSEDGKKMAAEYVQFRMGNRSLADTAGEYDRLKSLSSSIHLVNEESAFVKWGRQGGVFNADEINIWPTDTVVAGLNGVLDGEKVIVHASTGVNIKINDRAYFFAGMNPGYEGTVDLNAAFKSRCNIIEMGYPDGIYNQLAANFNVSVTADKEEPAFAEDYRVSFEPGNLPKTYLKKADTLFKKIRALVKTGRVSDDAVNIRGIVRALTMVSNFPGAVKLNDMIIMSVVNGCREDERSILTQLVCETIDF